LRECADAILGRLGTIRRVKFGQTASGGRALALGFCAAAALVGAAGAAGRATGPRRLAAWTGGPSAMGPATAVGILVVAAAIAAYAHRRRPIPFSEWWAVVAIGIGLVFGGGYLFGPTVSGSATGGASVAFATAVAVVLLGAAAIAADERGRLHQLLVSPGPAGQSTRALLAPISVIPIIVGAAVARLGLTADHDRVAAWLFAVVIAGLLVAAVLVLGFVEQHREHERAHLDALEDEARAQQRRRRTLEMMVAVAEEERNQIATDLHDDTIQVMTAALITIDRARSSVARDDHAGAERTLAIARATLGEALERTRRLMFELRPPALTEQGLRAALVELAAETGAATGANVDVDVVDTRFPEQVEGLAYRTVRELVVNARKHARARRIAIEIAAREQILYGVVHDDGVGFDPDSVRERPDRHLHLGLDAVEERVVLAGGTLEIDSAPMRGARVRFAIPLQAGSAA
jgi:signal transduction histidine kinase